MKKKTILLIAIAATAIIAGAVTGRLSRSMGLVSQAVSCMTWVLTYLWYKEDVLQRRVRTSTEFNGFVILFTLVALPAYFFRSRGIGKGAVASILFFLSSLGWLLLFAGTATLTLIGAG